MPILTTIPQCEHIKDDGIRCGSPALRGKDLCYFHLRQARRHPAFYIPPLKDRASIHRVLTEVMRAAFAGHIEDERLRTMLYALQIAISNLRKSEPAPGQRPGATQGSARHESTVTRRLRFPPTPTRKPTSRVVSPPWAEVR